MVHAKGTPERRSTPCRAPTVALTKASQSQQMVAPVCSRQGGGEGLTGARGAPVVLSMTNTGSSQAEGGGGTGS